MEQPRNGTGRGWIAAAAVILLAGLAQVSVAVAGLPEGEAVPEAPVAVAGMPEGGAVPEASVAVAGMPEDGKSSEVALRAQVETLSRLLRELEDRADRQQGELERMAESRREEEAVRAERAMREHLREPVPAELAWSLNDAGLLMAAEGRPDIAQVLFERALGIVEGQFGQMHPARGTVLHHLGDVLARRRDPEAIARYREAALVFGAVASAGHPRLAAVLNAWASALVDQGRPQEAEALYRRAIQVYEDQKSRYSLDMAAAQYNLGVLLLSGGRAVEAGAPLEQALQVLKRNRETDGPRALLVLQALVRQRQMTGKTDKLAHYEQLLNAAVVKNMERPAVDARGRVK